MELRESFFRYFRFGLFLGVLFSLVIYFWLGFWSTIGWLGGMTLGAGAILATVVVVGRTLSPSTPPMVGVTRVLMLQGAKLPIFVFVIFFTNSMGYIPAWTFLSGYFLVYLALIAGALGEVYAPSKTE